MTDSRSAKSLVCDYYAAIGADPAHVLETYCARDALWKGYHPFNEIHEPAKVAETFWNPPQSSLTCMQRRLDLFLAGYNHLKDGASMG